MTCYSRQLEQANNRTRSNDGAQPQFAMLSPDPKAMCSDEGLVGHVSDLRQSKQMSICCGLRARAFCLHRTEWHLPVPTKVPQTPVL